MSGAYCENLISMLHFTVFKSVSSVMRRYFDLTIHFKSSHWKNLEFTAFSCSDIVYLREVNSGHYSMSDNGPNFVSPMKGQKSYSALQMNFHPYMVCIQSVINTSN